MSHWIILEVERCLYVDRGQDVILCDRGHHGPITLVLKLQEKSAMTQREDDILIGQLRVCAGCARDSSSGYTYLNETARVMLRQAADKIEKLEAALSLASSHPAESI